MYMHQGHAAAYVLMLFSRRVTVTCPCHIFLCVHDVILSQLLQLSTVSNKKKVWKSIPLGFFSEMNENQLKLKWLVLQTLSHT